MRNSFEKGKIEYSGEREKEEKKHIEKLENFQKEISANLRKEGVPVNDECRVNMDAFKEIYDDVEGNKERIREQYGDIFKEENKKEKLKKRGEQLEILVNAIFYKFLREKFIVVRTSFYDDFKHKIDNLIVERKTGSVICAFDEVGDRYGPRFDEKEEKVLDRNIKGGGKLKYGLKVKDGKLMLGRQENIPVFYLALEEKYIKKGIKEFNPSIEEGSDFDKKLFELFISSIKRQISALNLEFNLNEKIRENFSDFEKILERGKK